MAIDPVDSNTLYLPYGDDYDGFTVFKTNDGGVNWENLYATGLENVSFVVPVTALSYGFGALGGKFFLREQVTRKRWAGVFLVCIGVGLVLIGHR